MQFLTASLNPLDFDRDNAKGKASQLSMYTIIWNLVFDCTVSFPERIQWGHVLHLLNFMK